MSVRVEGVLDLPHVDLRDMSTLHELLLFLKEHGICEELKDYAVFVKSGALRIEHTERDWSYVEITEDGRIFWDEHHEKTVEEKDAILSAIREYYPMFKKAMQIHSQVGGVIRYDKEKDTIILEVEE